MTLRMKKLPTKKGRLQRKVDSSSSLLSQKSSRPTIECVPNKLLDYWIVD